MPSLHDLETWRPALEALRDGAPTEASRSRFVGSLRAGSAGGQVIDDGAGDRQRDRGVAGPKDALLELAAEATPTGVGVVLATQPDGEAGVLLIDRPASISPGLDLVGDLLLVDGAIPQPYRVQPWPVPPTILPGHIDLDFVKTFVRQRLPQAEGMPEAEIAAYEKEHGIRLPGDLRTLYLVAREGHLVVSDEGDDPAVTVSGFDILPIGGGAANDDYLPENRFAEWRFGAKAVLDPQQDDAVQALAGSRSWLPFGQDGGGNLYAVDLTPGPGGNIGQVILLDHEANIGAELVARSITEMLQGRSVRVRRRDRPKVLRKANVNDRNGIGFADAVVESLQVLNLGVLEEAVDLAALTGHPNLRTVSGGPGTIADPTALSTLPALEYLELGVSDWRRVLDTDTVPKTLLAARVAPERDVDPVAVVEVSNELLARWERPQIDVQTITGQIGPRQG